MKDSCSKLFWVMALLAFVSVPSPVSSYDLTSYANVQEDGSLKVRGHIVHLYGIYIPPTERVCRTYVSPVRCGPRAVMQLEFKIDTHFVHCEEMERFSDGSISAVCKVEGQDLGAWMVQNGWALALPDAPFQYHALEKIARTRGVGVWGTPVGGLP
jgi:endonuclease YncB( thermonuclease family)